MPKMSPEARAKMSESMKARWAQRKEKPRHIEENVPRGTSADNRVTSPQNFLGNQVNLFNGEIRRLDVFSPDGTPGIPGFATRWFVDHGQTGVRLAMAKRSGWDFVQKDEVVLNDSAVAINGDLGNHVSQVANSTSDNGRPEVMYLMKIPQELFDKYQREFAERNDKIMGALRGAGSLSRDPSQFVAGSPLAQQTHSSLPPITTSTNLYR